MAAEPFTIAELETWIEARLQASGTPGAAVVLERNGKTLVSRGFGHRDVAGGLAPDTETVFGSGSITKSLTALAILLLEEDRLLTVGDAVSAHLLDLRLPGPEADAITIHHLLTHTSGVPPLPSRHYAWLSQHDLETFERAELERLPRRAPIRSFDELIAFLGEYPFALHAPPGEQYSYSNEGYNLLGAIIERVSGKSLPVFVQERILGPAAMSRSSLDLRFTLSLPNVTRLHIRRDGKVVSSPNWFNPACWLAAGGLRTTAADLARYFRMLAAGGVLDGVRIASRQSVRKMTTGHADKGDANRYGYGLTIADLDGHAVAEHGGGHKGVSAMAGFAAADGVVCVVLTNLATAPALAIWTACVRAALELPQAPLDEPVKQVDVPFDTLRDFAGQYVSAEAGAFRVVVDDAGGVIVAAEAGSVAAVPTAADKLTFVGPLGAQTIRFLRLSGAGISHALIGGRVVRRDEASDLERS